MRWAGNNNKSITWQISYELNHHLFCFMLKSQSLESFLTQKSEGIISVLALFDYTLYEKWKFDAFTLFLNSQLLNGFSFKTVWCAGIQLNFTLLVPLLSCSGYFKFFTKNVSLIALLKKKILWTSWWTFHWPHFWISQLLNERIIHSVSGNKTVLNILYQLGIKVFGQHLQ